MLSHLRPSKSTHRWGLFRGFSSNAHTHGQNRWRWHLCTIQNGQTVLEKGSGKNQAIFTVGTGHGHEMSQTLYLMPRPQKYSLPELNGVHFFKLPFSFDAQKKMTVS